MDSWKDRFIYLFIFFSISNMPCIYIYTYIYVTRESDFAMEWFFFKWERLGKREWEGEAIRF